MRLPQDEDPPANARPMTSSSTRTLAAVRNPHGLHVVKISPEDASRQAKTILIIFFPKSALFTLQEIEENRSCIPTMSVRISQQESNSIWKITA
jgi:hypothetical protein